PDRRRQAQVAVGLLGGDPAPGRPLQQPPLDQERLVDLLERRPVLADGGRERVEAHRPADELRDDGVEDRAVAAVEAGVVDAQRLEGLPGARERDALVAGDLGVVADAPQEPLRDAHRAAGAPADLEGGVGVEGVAEARRVLRHALGQLLARVELEVLDDAEAAAQRPGDEPRSRGGADEREAREVEPYRARGRSLAQHDVDLELLHRGVEVLLGHAPEAVYLVDEEDVALLERVREDGGEVAGLLDGRPGGHAYAHAHLVSDDVRQGGLAQPRGSVEEEVVEGLAPLPRRLQVDGQLALEARLPYVLRQGGRAQTNVLHGGIVPRGMAPPWSRSSATSAPAEAAGEGYHRRSTDSANASHQRGRGPEGAEGRRRRRRVGRPPEPARGHRAHGGRGRGAGAA